MYGRDGCQRMSGVRGPTVSSRCSARERAPLRAGSSPRLAASTQNQLLPGSRRLASTAVASLAAPISPRPAKQASISTSTCRAPVRAAHSPRSAALATSTSSSSLRPCSRRLPSSPIRPCPVQDRMSAPRWASARRRFLLIALSSSPCSRSASSTGAKSWRCASTSVSARASGTARASSISS